MADEWYSILQHEFSGEEGSFLLRLRCDLVWDKAAFSRLTAAMLECCKAYDKGPHIPPTLFGESAYDKDSLPRWLAEGFWFTYEFTKGHASHPAWSEKIAREPEYYDKAYDRLFNLADWFFTGQCGFLDPDKEFVPM
ncbi:MAG TPA: hypothetical protein VGF38_22775 [Ktedonobacterales bacterium]|jgi:hypothetical protein